MTALLEKIRAGILEADSLGLAPLIEDALAEGMAPWEIVRQSIKPALEEVGERYVQGVFFLPEMMAAATVANETMLQLKPHFQDDGGHDLGRVVLGTVRGDMHDIGKNVLGMMLQAAGFAVVDLGKDVDAEHFVKAVSDVRPRLVGLSALLTTTMGQMQETIHSLVEAGLREEVKVLVGGAPLSQELADEMGADGYAPDAAQAVSLARRLAN